MFTPWQNLEHLVPPADEGAAVVGGLGGVDDARRRSCDRARRSRRRGGSGGRSGDDGRPSGSLPGRVGGTARSFPGGLGHASCRPSRSSARGRRSTTGPRPDEPDGAGEGPSIPDGDPHPPGAERRHGRRDTQSPAIRQAADPGRRRSRRRREPHGTAPKPDDLDRVRPAGFEPATKGFKGPRVSAGLGLSHPPRPDR